ncbi:serine/threonine-protein kinase Nek11 [Astyanax mexicanus]|uniref:non-specific serine/threonine protein kinase n=1 Tax=Astyanax mexicanus TaxID=7994 RepID=A0A8T2KLC3_ASTMX|nr:serine/threonine-protein kinase Nek11 [Astyanax mexicanus]
MTSAPARGTDGVETAALAHRMDGALTASLTAHPRLACYDGSADWTAFEAQLEIVAGCAGWTDAETAANLCLALQGDALRDGDLDRKLEELRAEGNTLSEMQVIHWLVQLLLGVSYMHHRRILHRDLKAKNVFLKGNNMKIGDFGVSCLLMGSSDLATTFTGTPYYMSPEAISHRGYNSKSDIWSLGCILYEMCCLKHAFEGYNFLSVVMKIVEGSTPSLPESYSPELNSLMHRMLERDPRRRVSAEEALSCGVLEDLVQTVKQQFSELMLTGRADGEDGDVTQIARALQQKVHLQTLRERSEVEKMSPRERMRLRKLQAADERAKKLKKIVEEKYQENHHRMKELRSKHFQNISINVLKEKSEESQDQPIASQSFTPSSHCRPMGEQREEDGIPEDAQAAEDFYCEDGFESCSDEDDSSSSSSLCICRSFGQDSDLESMVRHMENVLEERDSAEAESSAGPGDLQTTVPSINTALVHSRIQYIRESVSQRLGQDRFQSVYNYLKETRLRRDMWDGGDSEDSVISALGGIVDKPADCFEVDQLLYYEELLKNAQATLTTPTQTLTTPTQSLTPPTHTLTTPTPATPT